MRDLPLVLVLLSDVTAVFPPRGRPEICRLIASTRFYRVKVATRRPVGVALLSESSESGSEVCTQDSV